MTLVSTRDNCSVMSELRFHNKGKSYGEPGAGIFARTAR